LAEQVPVEQVSGGESVDTGPVGVFEPFGAEPAAGAGHRDFQTGLADFLVRPERFLELVAVRTTGMGDEVDHDLGMERRARLERSAEGGDGDRSENGDARLGRADPPPPAGTAHWRQAPDVLQQTFRHHGIDVTAIADVPAAWEAFQEFAQVEFAELDPTPASDNDGIIVQWGRYSWNDHRYSVSFTRQFAVVDDGDGPTDTEWRPSYWQVQLDLLFDDEPPVSAFAAAASDTGFYFDPPGTARDEAFQDIEEHEQLAAVMRLTPMTSMLRFDPAD
jgi:hypothetical protein